MPIENIVWTALPNGIHESGDRLKVTLFVTPRLDTEGQGDPVEGLSLVGNFPAFESWPDTLAGTRFRIRFPNPIGVVDADLDADARVADADVWALLFKDSAVLSATFKDLSERRIRSFPVAAMSDAVLGLYTQVAQGSPEAFPPVTDGPLAELGRQIGSVLGHGEGHKRLDSRFGNPKVEGGEGRVLDRTMAATTAERIQMGFLEATRFYNRPGVRDPLGPKKVPPPPTVPAIDFHAFVGFCGDYPELLRVLGLAVDLLVPWDRAATPAGGRIRAEVDPPDPRFAFMKDRAARPWTHYRLDPPRFLADPRKKEGDLADGTLRLENTRRFLVNQIDIDGSALKTADFAVNVMRMHDRVGSEPRSMTPNAASLPALRSGGFTVARDERAGDIVDNLDHAATLEASRSGSDPADLWAEDVNRGYRIDVEDQIRPNRWLSLHAREGTYVVRPGGGPEQPIDIRPDEAYLKASSASATKGDDDLYIHETVFGWEGWSLAAGRPGRTIVERSPDDPPVPGEPYEKAGTPEAKNPTRFPLFTSFRPVEGTLPRLRFGRTYRFRARAVDLAGNSPPEDALVPTHVSDAETFRRFDPVPSPAVVPRRPFTEGESLLRMVLRSTLDVPVADYVALPRVTGLAGHTDDLFRYRATNERHLAAPSSSQQLAEWHGEFEKAIGATAPDAQRDLAFALGKLESGSFADPGPGVSIYSPDPTNATDLANRKKGDPLKAGEIVCIDVDQLDLPYLPDPLAHGASFTTLPGDAGTRLVSWEGGDWPDRRPLRLVIEEGTGAPDWDPAARLLTVQVPQAETVPVRLSSFFDPTELELFGIWMLEAPVFQGLQKPAALEGRHWMLSPAETLVLVHAVEKPLTKPVVAVGPWKITRHSGETFAVLDGAIDNHAKSTGRLDIEATWSEWVDDVNDPAGPTQVLRGGHVKDFQLDATEDHCLIGRDEQPALGSNPAIHEVRQEFRDTKHRWVDYHAVATTRFREYFPSEITGNPELITHAGDPIHRSVPSSRRPDPPEVLYVVPTWTWTERVIPGFPRTAAQRRRSVPTRGGIRLASSTLRTRTGGGLRVYLDRPWFSSGDDELLGVVVKDQPWFTWPIDIDAGLAVSEVARSRAELAAGELVGRTGKGAAVDRLLKEIRASGPERAARSRRSDPEAVHEAVASAPDLATLGLEASALLTLGAHEALGSLLGRIVFSSGDPDKFVTQWGVDPIWGSNQTASGPWIHQFPLRRSVGTGVSLLEAPGHEVAVIGHKPEYDLERGLWYCDLQLDAGTSYYPFVKLALARYQPYSISGVHLSKVVFPDFAALVTERTAVLTRVARGRMAVSLRGPGGFTQGALAATLGGQPEFLEGRSRFAVAQVERLPAGATTDLAWVPVGEEVHLHLQVEDNHEVRYRTTLTIPPKKSGEEQRITVREYEIFDADAEVREATAGISIDLFDKVGWFRNLRYRLVYADHLSV